MLIVFVVDVVDVVAVVVVLSPHTVAAVTGSVLTGSVFEDVGTLDGANGKIQS